MGILTYGIPGYEIVLEDRALTHLRIVILAKLRRDEKFAMSWDDTAAGTSRTIWLHPAIPLRFEIAVNPAPNVNAAWVEALTAAANSGSGLRIVPEPPSPPTPANTKATRPSSTWS